MGFGGECYPFIVLYLYYLHLENLGKIKKNKIQPKNFVKIKKRPV